MRIWNPLHGRIVQLVLNSRFLIAKWFDSKQGHRVYKREFDLCGERLGKLPWVRGKDQLCDEPIELLFDRSSERLVGRLGGQGSPRAAGNTPFI